MTIDETRFKALISGELEETEAAALIDQLRADREGRGLLELHELLRQGTGHVPEPTDDEFRQMRGGVLEAIRAAERQTVVSFGKPVPPGRGWLAPAAAIAATLLLAVGFLIGRGIPDDLPPVEVTSFPSYIEQVALDHRNFADVENSPLVFSDVRVQPLDGDRLSLAFNVSKHVELVRSRHDPLVTEVIVQSLLPSSNLPTRLQALDYAEASADGRLRDALVQAMLHDRELPVRLAALARLAPLTADPVVQDALMAVLEYDASVQMRLLAIDHLSAERLEPETFDRILSNVPDEQVLPLEVRARARMTGQRS